MDSVEARRKRWAAIGTRSLPLGLAAFFILVGFISVAAGSLKKRWTASSGTLIPVTAVTVERRDEVLTVRLQTGRTPKYRTSVLDAPARIVIDLEGARYAWCGPLTTNPDPIREVRAAQWQPGTA